MGTRMGAVMVLTATGLVVPLWRATAQEIVPPPLWKEMLEPGMSGLPVGWTNLSTGELKVQTAVESRGGPGGVAALRLAVPAWYAGKARLSGPQVTVPAGKSAWLEVSARGEGLSGPATIGLRADGAEGPALDRTWMVPAAWERAVLKLVAQPQERKVRLTAEFRGSGTLRLAELRLVLGEPPAAAPMPPSPPLPGNRVANSSFELGGEGWTPAEQVGIVKGASPEGAAFARWMPGPFPMEGRPILVRPGVSCTVSASLRSQREGARVEIALQELGGSGRATQTFDLTPDWKRCSFTTTLPCEMSDRYVFSLAPAGEAHSFDVDAVQIEEGALQDYRPSAAVEIAPGLTRSDLFPEPNEFLAVPTRLYAPAKIPGGLLIRYRLEGFYGEVLGFGQVPVPEGATHAEAPLRVRIPQPGTQRLLLESVLDGEVLSQSETILTPLPAAPTSPNPDSFFGAHGTLGNLGEIHAAAIASRAGVRWWRLHDYAAYTAWALTEPEQGKYRWFDREIDALRARGLSLLGVLERTPRWAAAPGSVDADVSNRPPARLADFANFARQVASHYRGRIEAYEIWNEPWSPTYWTGDAEAYADLARAGAAAIAAGDPAATVVAGSLYAPKSDFIDRVLARGLLGVAGKVSVHHYTDPEAVTYAFGDRDQVSQFARTIRGKLELASQQALPAGKLWNTEGGTPCPSYYSWAGTEEQSRAAARTVAKTLILSKSAGFQRFFYYYVWHEAGIGRTFGGMPSENLALLDFDGSGKPALAAYYGCARNLEGAVPAGRVETPTLKAYLFQRGGDTVVAAWSPTALVEPLNLDVRLSPTGASMENLLGNTRALRPVAAPAPAPPTAPPVGMVLPLRNEPIYLRLRGVAPAQAAAALREAMPWVAPPPRPKPAPDKPDAARPPMTLG